MGRPQTASVSRKARDSAGNRSSRRCQHLLEGHPAVIWPPSAAWRASASTRNGFPPVPRAISSLLRGSASPRAGSSASISWAISSVDIGGRGSDTRSPMSMRSMSVRRERLGLELLAAERHEQQERRRTWRTKEFGQPPDAIGVGPVKVVDVHDERLAARQAAQQLTKRGERLPRRHGSDPARHRRRRRGRAPHDGKQPGEDRGIERQQRLQTSGGSVRRWRVRPSMTPSSPL